jgi:hypothetical protein
LDDPRIKPAICLKLVRELLAFQKNIIYIDFDLQFSSLLQNLDHREFVQMSDSGKLSVVQPPDDILDFVASMARYELQRGGVLILDSLNSLQNLLTDERTSKGSKEANQKTALIVTVLQNISRYCAASLVIINVTKARLKSPNRDSSFWEKTLVGGRIIKFKSDAVLSIKNDSRDPSLIKIAIQESRDRSLSDLKNSEYEFRVPDISLSKGQNVITDR